MLSSLALLLFETARAASYDPALTWRTLRTEHFAVTFHDGEERLAEEMGVAAESAWDALTVELDYAPRDPIQIVLVDWTDTANGYATVLPQNTIVIFVTAPEDDSTLSLYEDWNRAIITHELTHILHIDTVRGLPRVARWLMGSLISTHQVSPGWIVEGYATFQETRHSGAGRGRNASVDMIKRAVVLEDRFPPLGNLDGFQALPPGGNLRYLFGQDFIQFIADRSGSEKWTEWVKRYGASVPFLFPAKKVFGASFTTLYREWRASFEARYRAQATRILADGPMEVTWRTEEGDACGAPAWSPDGRRLAWSCVSPRTGGKVYLSEDGAAPTVLLKDRTARNIAWRGDGEAFAFSATRSVGLYDQYEDIYLFELGKDAPVLLTDGARARDPAFSPDGARLLVVTNEAQQNQLAVLTVDKQLRPLTADTEHEQYATPRWSPDGARIAVSIWRDGLRDLWLLDPDGRPLRRLTADAALDRDPAWSADGRWLYFTSDRSGVPDVYAIELATERVFRVTNALTGAYGPAPSPDGRTLAFQVYATLGSRIATIALDPASWKPEGTLPQLPGQPLGALTGTVPASPPEGGGSADSTGDGGAEPPRNAPPAPPAADATPYNPLPSLLPPRFWVPSGYLTNTGDSWGLLGAAATYGADTLQQYAYSAYATYRTDADFFGGGGSFTVNRWRPVVAVGGSTSVTPYGDIYRLSAGPEGGGAAIPGVESALERYWDRRVRGYAQVGYPLDTRSSVSVYYTGTLRSPRDPLPADAYLAALPTRGFFSSVGAGWRYGKGTSYALSISPEQARSLAVAAEVTTRWLGSYTYDDTGTVVPFDQFQATAEWREYLANPWLPNHVLAWKLAGGVSVGDAFRYGSYRLGGTFSENGITVVPSEWRALRGFYPASDSGEGYWLASTEYRFPIWNIDRGVGTLPFFARNLSGALLVDAGNAFDDAAGAGLDATLLGVGAELRLYTIWAYGLGISTRLGYAFSALGGGIAAGDPNGFYATLGSSF